MKRNYGIVVLILITFFVISFLTNILGALNPSVSLSYELSGTMSGFLPFTFFIAYGLMSIPSGFMVEKYGEKRLMVFAFLLALTGSLLFSGFPTFGVFLFTLFTIGTGMAILQVVINPLLRVSGGEEHYAFTSVLAQLIFGAASFVSPQVYSWLVTSLETPATEQGWVIGLLSKIVPIDMSWASIYWIFALISLLMVLVIISIPFPKVQLNEEEKVGTKDTYIGLFKNRKVMLYFLGIFAYVGTEQGISYWMSQFLQDYHGYDFKTIGADAIGNFWGLMTIGGILGLLLLKIMDSKWVLRIFSICAVLSFSMALFGSANVSLYAFQVCGFFLSVMYPIIMSLALNSVSKHHGAFAGILMTGIMGGAVVQLLIGFVSDFTSLKTGMMIVFLGLGYILSISFWAKPIIKNKTIGLSKGKE
ncbi:MFS transporter [Flavobacteriaceae bacterium F89]|uniref:MFS transporter n=1 Tax=Cerina litoralis TaxID=2874477 RepID=A0AAE3EV10_9FLAO|nr:MFS transporter [Cerina litoralis]MCG2460177.1 MFS transporter [Cerina litoralis]